MSLPFQATEPALRGARPQLRPRGFTRDAKRMSTTNGQANGQTGPAPSLPHVDWARPHDDAVTQLERQLVRGSHFGQAAMDKLQARLPSPARLCRLNDRIIGPRRGHQVFVLTLPEGSTY